MNYLFLDCDEYLTSQRISELRAGLGDAEIADLNMVALEGPKTSAGEILSYAAMMPFLAPRRLVLVEGFLQHLDRRMAQSKSFDSAAHREAEELTIGLSQTPETSDIVFVDGKLDKRRALWTGYRRTSDDAGGDVRVDGLGALVKSGVIQSESLGTPDSRSLPGWVQRQAKDQHIDIDRQATASLANFVGPNLRQLGNELQKLAVYASGRTITSADVRLMVSDASEALIWDLTDAVSQRNAKGAMLALHALRRGDANPFYLLTMIARQYRIILKVKDAMSAVGRPNEHDIAKQVGESPYPVKKAMQQAGAYSLEELEGILGRLVETDFAMKTGADQDTEIDVLIAELTQRASTGRRSA